jgi:hypothetical protein
LHSICADLPKGEAKTAFYDYVQSLPMSFHLRLLEELRSPPTGVFTKLNVQRPFLNLPEFTFFLKFLLNLLFIFSCGSRVILVPPMSSMAMILMYSNAVAYGKIAVVRVAIQIRPIVLIFPYIYQTIQVASNTPALPFE